MKKPGKDGGEEEESLERGHSRKGEGVVRHAEKSSTMTPTPAWVDS